MGNLGPLTSLKPLVLSLSRHQGPLGPRKHQLARLSTPTFAYFPSLFQERVGSCPCCYGSPQASRFPQRQALVPKEPTQPYGVALPQTPAGPHSTAPSSTLPLLPGGCKLLATRACAHALCPSAHNTHLSSSPPSHSERLHLNATPPTPKEAILEPQTRMCYTRQALLSPLSWILPLVLPTNVCQSLMVHFLSPSPALPGTTTHENRTRSASCTPEPQHPGTPESWHPGAPAPQHPRTPAPWHPGAPALWNPRTPASRNPSTPETQRPGAPEPRKPSSLEPQHPRTPAPCPGLRC